MRWQYNLNDIYNLLLSRELLLVITHTFFPANSLCYRPNVCQSQRQLLPVVTSLNIHNSHVRNIHFLCCCIVVTLFTSLPVSVTWGKLAIPYLLCFLLYTIFLFSLVTFDTIEVCDNGLGHVHNSWILSTHGSLISDVVPNLCWKECLLHLFWNGIERGGKECFKSKIFKCFQVLNAVVLRYIFDKIWENEWMNETIKLKV